MTAGASPFRIAAVSLPVGIAYTLSWFGVFTLVNNYLHQQGFDAVAWTAATLWYTGSMVVWPFICIELSAKFGRRWTVAFAQFLCAACFLGLAYWHHWLAVDALLALMALSTATFSTVFLPMVAEMGGAQPGRALVIFNFTNTVVGAAALIGGGWLCEKLGYSPAFYLCAAACVLGGAVFLLLTRSVEQHAGAPVLNLRGLSRADVLALLTGPFLVVVLCGMSMEAFNYHTANQLWPNLARFHGLGDRTITTWVALARLPALLTLIVLAAFVDRVNIVRFYGFSFLFVGACVIGMGLTTSSAALTGAYLLYFSGQGFVWGSNSPALNASVSPRLRDAAFALMMIPAQLAVFLVGIIHNRLLAAGLSLPTVFVACGMIAVCGALVVAGYSFVRRGTRTEALIPASEK